jgi:hypothetical protein
MPFLLDPQDPLSEIIDLDTAASEVDRRPATIRSWVRDGLLSVWRVGPRVYTTKRAVRDAEREIWLRHG